MGRNAKPIELLQLEKKKHLTKAEIEQRRKSEIHFGDHELTCPDFVKADAEACKKWKEVTALYKDFDFVGSGDAGLLARYCRTFSEYLDLLSRRMRIDAISQDSDDVADYINDSERFDYQIRKKLLDMCSTSAVLNLDAAINKKMDMLIKMEDRLFLNPLSKVKSVPKKQEEEPPKSKWDAYKSG